MRTLKDVLDYARKGTNANYQAVVKGKRPSRKAKSVHLKLQNCSRDTVREYWTAKLEENSNK